MSDQPTMPNAQSATTRAPDRRKKPSSKAKAPKPRGRPPKPKPKNLTVAEARKLGLQADRRKKVAEAEAEEIRLDAERREAEAKAAEEKLAKERRKAETRKRREAQTSRNIKDPVRRSEAYTENMMPPSERPSHGEKSMAAKQRINRLRELIEPETEAMVKVMMDIAKDARHESDPAKYPSIHASIRLEAADKVLSRAYGKPKEHVEHSDAGDAAQNQDEVMTLLGNIFEAVGLPPLITDESAKPEG